MIERLETTNESSIQGYSEDEEDLLDIKIAHIFIVLLFSFVGMVGPLYLGKRISDANIFLLRAFAAGQCVPIICLPRSEDHPTHDKNVFLGVILGLAFCHMVPDSSEISELTEYRGLNGVLILIGMMLSLFVERLSMDLIQKKHLEQATRNLTESRVDGQLDVTDNDQIEMITNTHYLNTINAGDPHTLEAECTQKLKDSKALVSAHLVEVGVLVHTAVLGISVGTWRKGRASLIVFTVAMGFHQFFEGIGLGATVSAVAGISLQRRLAMVAAFTLSFPLSICAGIAISFHAPDPTKDALIAGPPKETDTPRKRCVRMIEFARCLSCVFMAAVFALIPTQSVTLSGSEYLELFTLCSEHRRRVRVYRLRPARLYRCRVLPRRYASKDLAQSSARLRAVTVTVYHVTVPRSAARQPRAIA
jgi:zinc transporter ZupT